MKVLAVCESPPTTDAVAGNGSTLISAKILANLPSGFDVRLMYFDDRSVGLDPETAQRCSAVDVLPVRGRSRALAMQPFTSLPTATWQRSSSDDLIVMAASQVDLVYLHGLHATSAIDRLATPTVVHEIDYWSQHWRQRARDRTGPSRAYDLIQASRAHRLEATIAERAAAVTVVSPVEAERMTTDWGRPVIAVPNGVDNDHALSAPRHHDHLLVFAGTLDYPPNVEAATRLAQSIFPRVRSSQPDARLVIAGRRPGPAVTSLTGPGVEIQADVPSMVDLLRQATVAVFPGRTGTGTKNTVSEAVAAGVPVVASRESARNQSPGPHLVVAESDREIAEHVIRLLQDPDARDTAVRAAREAGGLLRSWSQAASEMAAIWEASVP